MKIINNIANLFAGVGLAVFGGSLLFGAGSLTVLGWCVALPMFLGGTGIVTLNVIAMLPEKAQKKVEDAVNRTEKDGYKAATA